MIRGRQSLEVLGNFWENLPMSLSTLNAGGGLESQKGVIWVFSLLVC